MTSEMIRLGIIDDNRIVREALTVILNAERDMEVVAADNCPTSSFIAASPHLVLLDVSLRDQDSLTVATQLLTTMPAMRIVLMDLAPTHDDVVDFVSAGVGGFVLKETGIAEFLATLRAVASGGKVLPAQLTHSLFAQIAKEVSRRNTDALPNHVRMTRREREVIALIGDGLSNKEIATRLNIATHTVKSHVRNVMEKLALHTRLQIAAYSHRGGMP
jgi:DNA-binding NarL/FixJ family response regulator